MSFWVWHQMVQGVHTESRCQYGMPLISNIFIHSLGAEVPWYTARPVPIALGKSPKKCSKSQKNCPKI